MKRWIVTLGLLACLPAGAALLWQVPEEQPLPPLTAMRWQPDLFVGAGLRTMDEAAEKLCTQVGATPGDDPLWIRLDAFDLCSVGDCESCQPPPEDPHRVVADAPPGELQPGHLRFAALANQALAATRARPYLVVPAGQLPPLDYRCDTLLVLLASPPLTALRDPAVYDTRRAQRDAWRRTGAEVRHLITDGMGDPAGLPLCADLLREQAAELKPSLLLARDRAHATVLGPAALAQRIRAVAVDGATTPVGDRLRADDPDTARLLDVYSALDGGGGELGRLTLDCLAAGAAWDDARAGGRAVPTGLTELLARRAKLTAPPSSGPLSAAWSAFVAKAEPLPHVTLPKLGEVTIDGERIAGEWDRALHLNLTRDDSGQTSARPGEVWLGLSGDRLVVAAVGTEPVPAEATLRDRLVVTLSRGEAVVRLAGDVGGKVSAERLARRGAPLSSAEADGARCVGLFDGPGWSLEMSIPLAAIGLDLGAGFGLNVATEHLRGREHWRTLWLPTCGGAWQPERNARATLG
ncbi:MAG: hypothetical protein HZB16_20555 [Armatimonadetes bacterium]|nr:hypothetical protein [Armatimonadota bacterium]